MTSESSGTVSLIIPFYNEEQGLRDVLERMSLTGIPDLQEIILVDDGSTDRSVDVVNACGKNLPLRLIRHPTNRGYGAALRTGIRAASGSVVITMDADGQHTPEDAAMLARRMGEADMVIGERGRSSFQHRRRRPGKWLLGMLARFLTGRRIPDLNSGLRAMRRDMITRYLHLLPDGFSASTTMTIAALKRGRPVVWVPITAGSPLGDSQVHVLRDGFGTVLLILRLITLFDPLRIFLPAAALFLITGFISGVYYFFYGSYGGGVSVGSLLLLVTGMLLFFSGLLADQIAALRLERYE